MFPGRTPEQIITDLLATALQEIETSMPYVAGKKGISNDEQGDPIYEDVGLTPRFVELTRKSVSDRSYPLSRPVTIYYTIDNEKTEKAPEGPF